jgi:hypothetical protein
MAAEASNRVTGEDRVQQDEDNLRVPVDHILPEAIDRLGAIMLRDQEQVPPVMLSPLHSAWVVTWVTLERHARAEKKIAEAGSGHTGKPRARRAKPGGKRKPPEPAQPRATRPPLR